MTADLELTLTEFVAILREGLQAQTGLEPGEIRVTSYDSVRITISADNKVDCEAFTHYAKWN